MKQDHSPLLEKPLFTPIEEKHNGLLSEKRFSGYLQLYLCAVIFTNLLLLHWNGNGGDIGFWENWVSQLASRGYSNFDGNYPPIYVHWLYLISIFYNATGLPIDNNLLLKYLSQLPVLASHLALVGIAYHLLKKYCTKETHFHGAMLLTAFNPAILLDGPIWGQIDIIPVIPVILAILVSNSQKYQILTLPLYTLALLVKFQMIAIAPLMGVIFFRNIKIHLLGIIISLALIAVMFTPAAISGNAVNSFKLAYVNVVHQYGATTMGASNIWILITGNAAPDHLPVLNVNTDSLIYPLVKAKNVGILLFFLVCLLVFLQGMHQLINRRLFVAHPETTEKLFFYATLCAIAFYTFLPAMHERYLLPAVILALIYYCLNPQNFIYPLALTFISAFNLAMTLGIRTNHVWPIISWFMLAVCIYAILDASMGKQWSNICKSILRKAAQLPYISILVGVLAITFTTYRLQQEFVIREPLLEPNQQWLSDLPITRSHQDFGKLQINKNIHGNSLNSDNRRYGKGFGTHANSTIEINLPNTAQSLSFMVGLDDAIESASVQFSVWGDGQQLWQSKIHYGAEKPEKAHIDLKKVRFIQLKTHAVDSNNNDHANWLNPVLTLSHNSDIQTVE